MVFIYIFIVKTESRVEFLLLLENDCNVFIFYCWFTFDPESLLLFTNINQCTTKSDYNLDVIRNDNLHTYECVKFFSHVKWMKFEFTYEMGFDDFNRQPGLPVVSCKIIAQKFLYSTSNS